MMMESKQQPEQLSFLPPDDLEFVQLLRRFVAEASRIYEVRTGSAIEQTVTIKSPADAYEFVRAEMADLRQEQVRVLNLNVRHGVISAPLVYQGTVSGATVRAAEIFRPAVIENAAGIIVAHNHPSGDVSPSPDDVRLTQQLREAGKILDIELMDHLIVARHGFASLRERGMGFGP